LIAHLIGSPLNRTMILFGIVFWMRYYKYEWLLPNFYLIRFGANNFSMSVSLGCSVVSEVPTRICRCCWTRYMFFHECPLMQFLWYFRWQFFCPVLSSYKSSLLSQVKAFLIRHCKHRFEPVIHYRKSQQQFMCLTFWKFI